MTKSFAKIIGLEEVATCPARVREKEIPFVDGNGKEEEKGGKRF